MELEQLLAAKGHRVIPYCAASPRNQETSFKHYFPRSISAETASLADAARFVYSADARRNMDSLLSAEKIDLAHLHIYYGKLTASIFKPLKDRNIPIVQSLHEYKLLCPVYTCVSGETICERCAGQYFWHVAAKRCNRGSFLRSVLSATESYVSKKLGAATAVDHFIGVSGFMTRKMVEMGIPEDKISTIHNFIDVDEYIPAEGPGKYLLYFGRLEKVKGVFTLLSAMEYLPDIELIIAGSGNAEAAMKSQIAERNLSNVSFAGFLDGDELHSLVRGAVCTVIPSEWYENCPMSILESFALGRPVVGSRIGGIPELINDGLDGILFQPENVQSLVEALALFIEDTGYAEQCGKKGRIKVKSDFSHDGHYKRLIEVYEKVLA